MPYTQVFDEVIYDSAIFDTSKRYSADIVEKKTLFDGTNNLFDPVVFDTVAGGIITVSDTVSRLMETYRTMPESVSISDSISRQLGSYRTISEATISVGVGLVERLLTAFRTITGVSVTTFADFELILKVVLLILSIGYTIARWRTHCRNNKKK